MIYVGWERRETEEKILEEGEKKRRRAGEKRYKEEMNKKVDGQRKRKPEKKHKSGKSLSKEYNWKGQGVKGQKEKRKRNELPGEIITGVKLGIKEKGEEERCIAKKFI
jgi:hypothetical protein